MVTVWLGGLINATLYVSVGSSCSVCCMKNPLKRTIADCIGAGDGVLVMLAREACDYCVHTNI